MLPFLLSALTGCQKDSAEPHLRFRAAAHHHSSSIFDLYYTPPDKQAADDIAAELIKHLPRLRNDFRYDYPHRVAVEIFPDQSSYDSNLMDRSVAGSPACSGRRTIQMVSPRSPIRIPGISYAGRLGMAVHELAHLIMNEINRDLPTWLNEGVASYAGGADGYRNICKIPAVAKLLQTPPSLTALETSYHRQPAPDVMSFTLVDFIVTTRGMTSLNDLLRDPAGLERIVGSSRRDIEIRWHEFARTRYRSAH